MVSISKARLGWMSQHEEFDIKVPMEEVLGSIPKDLKGTFYRNGPGNSSDIHGTALVHPIDGDGYVVGLSFGQNEISLKSKYVATRSRQEEMKASKMLFEGTMGSHAKDPLRIPKKLLKFISGRNPLKTRNPSNTNILYWGNRLISTFESKRPYRLRPDSLDTLGPEDLNGELELGVLGAHFRFDVKQKRLVLFSLRPSLKGDGELVLYEFDEEWTLRSKRRLVINGLNYAHDFMITDDYYIFHQTPFVSMDKRTTYEILLGLKSQGESMRHYLGLPSRFVFIPRKEECGPIISIDTDPCHIFHFSDCWSESPLSVNFVAAALGTGFDMTFDQGCWLSNFTESPGQLFRYSVNLEKKTCHRDRLSSVAMEFPVSRQSETVGGSRFTYAMASGAEDRNIPFTDIVKVRHEDGATVSWKSFGTVGEPVFVTKAQPQRNDDGYLIVQVLNPESEKTEFVVLDAIQMTQIARIPTGIFIPNGFHGNFVPDVTF